MFTAQVNSTGDVLWTDRAGYPADDELVDKVVIDRDYHVSVLADSSAGLGDLYTVSYSSDGTKRWASRYSGNGNPDLFVYGRTAVADTDDNVYVAASLHGERGIIRITPQKEASVALSGAGLVGLAFTEAGEAVLATNSALYTVDLGVEGRLSR